MTWRCDSAAVSVWVDKIMCCWWRPEFAVQQQGQLEKEIKDVRNQNCNLEELVDMSSAKAVRQAKEKQRELEKQLQLMKYQAEQNRRIDAKEIQKLKKRMELQLEKISEIKLFCGIGYVAAVIFAVCLIEICIL